MDPHECAVWYRMADLISRPHTDLAVEIIEAEARAARHEIWLEPSQPRGAHRPAVVLAFDALVG